MKRQWTREDILSLDAAHRIFRDSMHNGHRGSLDAVLDAVVRGLNNGVDDGQTIAVAEAAAAAGVNETSIRRWCRNGRIPGARFVNGQWLMTAGGLAAAGLNIDAPHPPADDAEQGTLFDNIDAAAESAVTAALSAVVAALLDNINAQRKV